MNTPGKFNCKHDSPGVPALLSLAIILLLLPQAGLAAAGENSPGNDPGAANASSAAASGAATSAVSESFWSQPHMLDNDASRGRLAEHGVNFDAFYIIDALGDPSAPAGARQEFVGWGRVRATVDLDFGQFSGAKGLTYHATGLWQYGQNMGSIIDSIANPSGLVSIHTFRLDSMFLQQSLLQGKLFLKAGQFAAQDTYGLQVYGGNFLMEPLDYAFGNMGNVRASWDPASGPAGEVRVVPTKYFYVRSGWYSGRNYSSTGFNYRKQDSSSWDSEVGVQTFLNQSSSGKRYSGIVKVGAVYNGGNFFNYQTGATVKDNYTVYVQAAQPVYRVEARSNRGIDLTAGVNTGPAAKSEVPTEYTFGATFNAPIAGRRKDAVSFGLVYSKIGSSYNSSVTTKLSDEKGLEFNYKAQITPWMLLQPVFQYYVNVGGQRVPHPSSASA